jgi:hypothetical protein
MASIPPIGSGPVRPPQTPQAPAAAPKDQAGDGDDQTQVQNTGGKNGAPSSSARRTGSTPGTILDILA